MKAVCWYGTHDVRVENVPEPKIINARDAVVRVTSTAICGSDLHLYDGSIPSMKKGDILGHEFMGEVIEVGREVRNLKKGDRVVAPAVISCGLCFYCLKGLWALCSNSNPNAAMADRVYGMSGAGLFGFSHMYGGYAGGQAQYARVPFADVGLLKIPEGIPDEKAVFLSDIFPTGYMAAENCSIEPGDVVAVWGCGPVGQFAIRSAYMLGAARVIAFDHVPERLDMARQGNAEAFHYEGLDVVEKLKEVTGGRGPDACIDAVGMEAHGTAVDAFYDRARQAVRLETGCSHVLGQCIQACRPGGTVSVPGLYSGFIDKFPIGAAFAKALTLKIGSAHMHNYMKPLLARIERGEIDPGFVVTHRVAIDEAPRMYKAFRNHEDHCVKVLLKPN